VHLTDLPRRYWCDELWSKFRVVLISLGAGRVDEVVPSDCDSKSPDVHLQFLLPRLMPGASAGDGDMQAAASVVALAPGRPADLRASDCHLVREISQSLLTDLPIKVESAQFGCLSDTTPSGAHAPSGGTLEHYVLRIRALLPQWPQRSATPTEGPAN